MAHDVFISYATEDKTAADAICAILESERIRCWVAPRDVLPGTSYAKAIGDAIEGARVLVVVFSSSTNRSRHVPREADLALNRGMPILQFRLEEVRPSDALVYYFAGQHWLDALVPPLEASIRRLAGVVRALLPGTSASGSRDVVPGQVIEPRTGMELVQVGGGSFEMGDLDGDGQPNEVPVRMVEVASFLMGRFAVTQGQWQAVMGSNPSRVKEAALPVTNVSWFDAQAFVAALNVGGPARYRLPTEAEWEYAARSGGQRQRWAGTSDLLEVDARAWTYANSKARTHPVGELKANGLGLYDMSGNVWEWCADLYEEHPGMADARTGAEQEAPEPGPDQPRVYRGGSWINPVSDARCCYRGNGPPTGRASSVGFRVARMPA